MRVTRATCLGTSFALLVLAPAAHADDDGGATSVFALGAGNRALGLGGAYAAVANDAGAPTWNPAGLALIQQRQFQVSHASLYGLDITEQYAAFAFPSWRWGTGALVVRRLGIDGIERRTDRNTLLSDDLQDAETEFLLSWGRSLGEAEAWSVGGSVKVQRQSLAGYSDNGIGFDLGLLLRPAAAFGRDASWMNRVNLGLAVRNLIEPAVRLDQESVSDPTAVRTGLSYRHPFLQEGYVLGAVDLEKSTKTDANLHAGLEISPIPLLSLRAGVNDGQLTAGSSIRWRQISVDYVFEDNDVESVNRFGLGFAFGPTIQEQRLASQRAEEEKFAQRLAESFQRRQAEEVKALLQRGQELFAGGNYDQALDVVATITTLDDGNEEAVALQAKCLLAKAEVREYQEALADAIILYGRVLAIEPENHRASTGLDRCRTKSNERAERTAMIRDSFAAALDAFSAGDLVTARETLRGILEIAPDDLEVKNMLVRTETAIRVRVTDLLARSGRFIDRGLLPEAEDLLDEARGLDPTAEGLDRLSARLAQAEERLAAASRTRREEKVATQTTTTTITPKAPQLSRKKRKEIADLYRRGMDAAEAGATDDALRYWELVWMADPEYQNVADYLKREYLLRGLESFSQGGLEKAISLWERALDVDPSDEKTLGYLARAREQQSRAREILGE